MFIFVLFLCVSGCCYEWRKGVRLSPQQLENPREQNGINPDEKSGHGNTSDVRRKKIRGKPQSVLARTRTVSAFQ